MFRCGVCMWCSVCGGGDVDNRTDSLGRKDGWCGILLVCDEGRW